MTETRWGTAPMDRRRFLQGTAALAGMAALAQLPLDRVLAGETKRLSAYPFSMGVASGDPRPDSVVLWTRLAPNPLEPRGGMPQINAAVPWHVATDPRMRDIVASGTALALPEFAHTVHVDVHGLEPAREYFYRFAYGSELSVIGRTKTAPGRGAQVGALSFAFASCQAWEAGYYGAYRDMAEQDLDFVVHLGDYIYEYAVDQTNNVRLAPVPSELTHEAQTVDDYRVRFGLYKSDPVLQHAHARFPFIVTWDDHEVDNDYAGKDENTYGGAGDQTVSDEEFLRRRAAAYRAYYEHQPIRASSLPKGPDMRLHRRLTFGNLADLSVLDTRQYRSAPPCGFGEQPACDQADDPDVTMLGPAQQRWLLDGLARSRARWNVLAQQVMMARLDLDGPLGEQLWHDSWDGYPAARKQITSHLVNARVRNPVVITGDWHSTFVNDIKLDFDKQESPVVATEFVGTSISSGYDLPSYMLYYGPRIPFNPHIKFFEGDRRGYVRCRLDHEKWVSDLRMVAAVTAPDAPAYTLASFVVEDGVPGAQLA